MSCYTVDVAELDCHAVDVAGCESIMQTIMEYPNSIVSWTHTPGEYDEYDMEWVSITSSGEEIRYRVEAKDRDMAMDRFRTAYVRENKFSSMVQETERIPVVACGYHDGVLVWQLNYLPLREIMEDIADSKKRFSETRHKGESIVKYNKWTEWRYVWNKALKKHRWELNVTLPIYKENKRGFKRLKKHVN